MPTRLVRMLQQNPGIKDLTISGYSLEMHNVEFMQTVASSCPNLRTLNVLDGYLNAECTKLLLDVCVRLTALNLDHTSLEGALGTEDVDRWPGGFPKLRRLDVRLRGRWNVLRIVQKCPQLKSLTWDMYHRSGSISDLPEVIAKRCPSLDELKLVRPLGMSTDLACVLSSCHKLSSLTLQRADFNLAAQSALTRHFSYLTHLDVRTCPSTQSSLVHQILTSCRHLEHLSAPRLDVGDMITVPLIESVVCATPEWVCTQLRTLEVAFCGFQDKPSTWHTLILEQLGRLTKLEVLRINWLKSCVSQSDGLYLRLGTGLDLLSRMNNLRILGAQGHCQEWDEDDVQWMVTTWTRLQEIRGTMHSDCLKDGSLKCILEKRNVKWTL
ncbi:hypothetical protein B0O80DRAFT_458745 [Mortierella sp. GBAus27b]|nr:hypothetical protein B0O80DRAFT_458745 [Mortierella sp. GBAus27b]